MLSYFNIFSPLQSEMISAHIWNKIWRCSYFLLMGKMSLTVCDLFCVTGLLKYSVLCCLQYVRNTDLLQFLSASAETQ